MPTGLLTWQLRIPLAWDGVLTPSKFNKKTTLQVDSEIVSTLPFSSTLLASLMQALWPDPGVTGETRTSDVALTSDNVWERERHESWRKVRRACQPEQILASEEPVALMMLNKTRSTRKQTEDREERSGGHFWLYIFLSHFSIILIFPTWLQLIECQSGGRQQFDLIFINGIDANSIFL